MTRANHTIVGGSVPASPALPRERKAVLFCPRCEHGSPIGGDWIIFRRADGDALHCPVCYELLTVRPIGHRVDSHRDC